MKWVGRRQSGDVRRSGGLGRGGMAVGGGLGGIVIFLLIALLGGDPSAVLDTGGPAVTSAQQSELQQFVSVVLADTEDVWGQLFPQEYNRAYQDPTLASRKR